MNNLAFAYGSREKELVPAALTLMPPTQLFGPIVWSAAPATCVQSKLNDPKIWMSSGALPMARQVSMRERLFEAMMPRPVLSVVTHDWTRSSPKSSKRTSVY